jgi:citrate lyase subunit beta / citryl-CoA lyase
VIVGGADPLDIAASLLFVPATRPERVAKAQASGAHQVIVDLEDAVAPADKDAARAEVAALSVEGGCLVRINGPGTPFHDDDLAAIAGLGWVTGVVVPKVGSGDDLAAVSSRLPDGVALLPLIESAVAIRAVDDIADGGATRLLLGSADYSADLGVEPGAEVLAYPRSRLVVASAAAGLAPPVDGPALRLDDPAGLAAEAALARSLGFTGKLCIHPAQVGPVNDAFAPRPDEVAWARDLLEAAEAAGTGVFVHDGTMVDAPVLRRARRILGDR